jgi:hypothetical protein
VARTVSLAGAAALVLLLSASSCTGSNAVPPPWNVGHGIAESALPTVPVLSVPKLGSARVGYFSYGEKVKILCQTRGSTVHAFGAASNVWYKATHHSVTGYVPSVYARPDIGKPSVNLCK